MRSVFFPEKVLLERTSGPAGESIGMLSSRNRPASSPARWRKGASVFELAGQRSRSECRRHCWSVGLEVGHPAVTIIESIMDVGVFGELLVANLSVHVGLFDVADSAVLAIRKSALASSPAS